MRLLEVNGRSLLGATHQEAVNILRACGDTIHLVVCKGYERSEVERLISEGKLIRESKNNTTSSSGSRSQSVSSLDRDDEDIATIKQEKQMNEELVEFEKEEEAERRLRKVDDDDAENMSLVEAREKSTPEKVIIILYNY